VHEKPFCTLLHFRRDAAALPPARAADPRVLIVAPLSGHYATLLRGTVEAMLPEHDVYVTDWTDARTVPLLMGRFGLDEYIDYLIGFMRLLGPNLHVMAVCQPGPAALAATAILAAADDPAQPATLTLMGSPIDTRLSPTVPNELATSRPLEWFEQKVIMTVPWPNPGVLRRVYPGFLQLTGFMTMNMDRHVNAHLQLYRHLIAGDGESADAHRTFYDEYLSVLDMTAEFYLETIRVIFQNHDLPDGRMRHRGEPVQPRAIRRTALMTVEGERDDISGVGQTQAAHALCTSIPTERRCKLVHPKVGHYGIFNGRRWREEIQPAVRDFMRANPTPAGF
jgi:poly(3-hydroxybutyrate) depolymerase